MIAAAVNYVILPCGIFADKCSACRWYAQAFFDQFAVPVNRPPTLEWRIGMLEARVKLLEQDIASAPRWEVIRQLDRRIDNAVHGPLPPDPWLTDRR